MPANPTDRGWRAWTRPEELHLARLYEAGISTRRISRILKRSVWAVERRASDMRARGEFVPYAEKVGRRPN